jgi:hypothetical protein
MRNVSIPIHASIASDTHIQPATFRVLRISLHVIVHDSIIQLARILLRAGEPKNGKAFACLWRRSSAPAAMREVVYPSGSRSSIRMTPPDAEIWILCVVLTTTCG